MSYLNHQRRDVRLAGAAVVVLAHIVLVAGLWSLRVGGDALYHQRAALKLVWLSLPKPPPKSLPRPVPAVSPPVVAAVPQVRDVVAPRRVRPASAAPGFTITLPPDFAVSAPGAAVVGPAVPPPPVPNAMRRYWDQQNQQLGQDDVPAPGQPQGTRLNRAWLNPNCKATRGAIVCTEPPSLAALKAQNDREQAR